MDWVDWAQSIAILLVGTAQLLQLATLARFRRGLLDICDAVQSIGHLVDEFGKEKDDVD